jgi:hypothetical protein
MPTPIYIYILVVVTVVINSKKSNKSCDVGIDIDRREGEGGQVKGRWSGIRPPSNHCPTTRINTVTDHY